MSMRDDAGDPKTARFIGVTRARSDSRAWKKENARLFRDFGMDSKSAMEYVESIGLLRREKCWKKTPTNSENKWPKGLKML